MSSFLCNLQIYRFYSKFPYKVLYENITQIAVIISLMELFFLDLKKAFDSVNHLTLIEKLCHYTILGKNLEFFNHTLQIKNRNAQSMAISQKMIHWKSLLIQ